MPEWAKKLYQANIKRLTYPRSYSDVGAIRNFLRVRNPHASTYGPRPSPAGLFALAKICESETLEKIDFLDKDVHAYKIDHAGKKVIVLWRTHGRPSDFVPVLLKDLPSSAVTKTTYGTILPIQRRGNHASINVGTWPIYLGGCSELTEIDPFKVSVSGEIGKDNKIEFKLTECIGDGELYVDAFNDKISHPRKIAVSNKEASVSITVPIDLDAESVSIRLAGTLNGIYVGKMIILKGKMFGSNFINTQGYVPQSINKVANCRLDNIGTTSLLQMKRNGSLLNLPERVKVGNIPFEINKGDKAKIAIKY